ncbi:MAG: helix-turn-helix domain-containing protein [Corynebacterium sp.]|nr:helix-turn-helix domain-containing protein [Corynebacterium sp.]
MKHSPEQAVRKLQKVEKLIASGMSQAKAAEAVNVSPGTIIRWRAEYGQMTSSKAAELTHLRQDGVVP